MRDETGEKRAEMVSRILGAWEVFEDIHHELAAVENMASYEEFVKLRDAVAALTFRVMIDRNIGRTGTPQ